MKSISDYIKNNYTPEEIELAYEIAERLNDPSSIPQFLGYAREVPHERLREFLENACSAPAHVITSSRAAIFVSKVNKYKWYPHGYTRN